MDIKTINDAVEILKKQHPGIIPIYLTLFDDCPVIAATFDKSDPFLTQFYLIDLSKKDAHTIAVNTCLDSLANALKGYCYEFSTV